ncbi:hypothetical protein BC828DRAFT_372083 [Blastocladiella britannica]|nr:hypothetical protein BC828DRAFT_372083 [Blastocladiella britannica]
MNNLASNDSVVARNKRVHLLRGRVAVLNDHCVVHIVRVSLARLLDGHLLDELELRNMLASSRHQVQRHHSGIGILHRDRGLDRLPGRSAVRRVERRLGNDNLGQRIQRLGVRTSEGLGVALELGRVSSVRTKHHGHIDGGDARNSAAANCQQVLLVLANRARGEGDGAGGTGSAAHIAKAGGRKSAQYGVALQTRLLDQVLAVLDLHVVDVLGNSRGLGHGRRPAQAQRAATGGVPVVEVDARVLDSQGYGVVVREGTVGRLRLRRILVGPQCVRQVRKHHVRRPVTVRQVVHRLDALRIRDKDGAAPGGRQVLVDSGGLGLNVLELQVRQGREHGRAPLLHGADKVHREHGKRRVQLRVAHQHELGLGDGAPADRALDGLVAHAQCHKLRHGINLAVRAARRALQQPRVLDHVGVVQQHKWHAREAFPGGLRGRVHLARQRLYQELAQREGGAQHLGDALVAENVGQVAVVGRCVRHVVVPQQQHVHGWQHLGGVGAWGGQHHKPRVVAALGLDQVQRVDLALHVLILVAGERQVAGKRGEQIHVAVQRLAREQVGGGGRGLDGTGHVDGDGAGLLLVALKHGAQCGHGRALDLRRRRCRGLGRRHGQRLHLLLELVEIARHVVNRRLLGSGLFGHHLGCQSDERRGGSCSGDHLHLGRGQLAGHHDLEAAGIGQATADSRQGHGLLVQNHNLAKGIQRVVKVQLRSAHNRGPVGKEHIGVNAERLSVLGRAGRGGCQQAAQDKGEFSGGLERVGRRGALLLLVGIELRLHAVQLVAHARERDAKVDGKAQ